MIRLDLDRLNRRYGPWISLAMGVGALLLVRRGAGYAPVAALFLLAAWAMAALLFRFFPEPDGSTPTPTPVPADPAASGTEPAPAAGGGRDGEDLVQRGTLPSAPDLRPGPADVSQSRRAAEEDPAEPVQEAAPAAPTEDQGCEEKGVPALAAPSASPPAPAVPAVSPPAPAAPSALPAAPVALPSPSAAPSPWRARAGKVVRFTLGTGSVSLYQNVLFFLLPLWFVSATWRSPNILFPLLLAGMALLSCFEYPYRRWVLQRPWVRAIFSTVVLFAVLVPAVPLVTFAPQTWAFAGAAALASLPALLSLPGARPRTRPRRRRLRLAAALALPLLAAGLAVLLVPLLPPLPLQCVESGMGRGLSKQLQLTGRGDHFLAGTSRVHAWFAVAAPPSYRQKVQFVWYAEGQRQRSFAARIVGGRKQGFRTWDYMTVRRPGSWHVDLRSESGGLIARQFFRVSGR